MTTEPPWVERLLALSRDPAVLGPLAGFSVVLFALSIVGVPWFVARLPEDYFSQRERRHFGVPSVPRRGFRLVLLVLRNAVGAMLFLAGVLMLFLPGQGLLTMIVALGLLDFPGKHRLQRRLVSAPPVLKALNALRRRADRPPLVIERTTPPPGSGAP
jgi:hypothetical protein